MFSGGDTCDGKNLACCFFSLTSYADDFFVTNNPVKDLQVGLRHCWKRETVCMQKNRTNSCVTA